MDGHRDQIALVVDPALPSPAACQALIQACKRVLGLLTGTELMRRHRAFVPEGLRFGAPSGNTPRGAGRVTVTGAGMA
jgi:phosphosulfolactate phosphohydrolase-like enzyme